MISRPSKPLEGFRATTAAVRQRLGELSAATASAIELLEEAEQGARRLLSSIRDLAPYPRSLATRVAAVESDLEEIVESKGGAGANRLDALRDELGVSLAALRRAARRPPETLTRAVRAFFSGDYDAVLELTQEVVYGNDSRSRSHRCLLRAAARHAIWLLGGERDDSLRKLAVDEIVVCTNVDSQLTPSPRFFSPRFVDFHAATRAALSETAGIDSTAGGGAADDPPSAADTEPAVGEAGAERGR